MFVKLGKSTEKERLMLEAPHGSENDGDGCACARLAMQVDVGVMQLRAVLHDGQPQTRTAHGAAATLVHAIESLEDTQLLIRRNADTRILHCDLDMPLELGDKGDRGSLSIFLYRLP